jgi:hypothetical protein
MLLTALVRENWTALAAEKAGDDLRLSTGPRGVDASTTWVRQSAMNAAPSWALIVGHGFLCKSPTSDVIEKIVQLQVVGTQRSNS